MNYKALKIVAAVLIMGSVQGGILSQELAITENGDSVYLFDNGMWSYDLERPEGGLEEFEMYSEFSIIDSTNTVYTEPKSKQKKLDKTKQAYSIAFDNKIWKRVPVSTINDEADYTLISKDEEMYGMIIYEKVEIGLNAIMNIAMSNVKDNLNVNPDIIHSDYVMVNGKQMIHATYKVNIQDLKFVFDSFYYSGEEGTVQFTAWTFANIYKQKQAGMLKLLSSLIVK